MSCSTCFNGHNIIIMPQNELFLGLRDHWVCARLAASTHPIEVAFGYIHPGPRDGAPKLPVASLITCCSARTGAPATAKILPCTHRWPQRSSRSCRMVTCSPHTARIPLPFALRPALPQAETGQVQACFTPQRRIRLLSPLSPYFLLKQM